MMLHVNVQLFAGAAAAVGCHSVDLRLPTPATVADLSAAVGQAYPALLELLPHSRWAIGTEFVALDFPLSDSPDCPVAMIPPVSGG